MRRAVDTCSTIHSLEHSLRVGLSVRGVPDEEVARTVEGAKPHPEPSEGVRPTLFTIHDAHSVADDEAGVPKSGHRLGKSAAGCDDVLQKAHEVPPVERAFNPIRCTVFLRLTSDDDEGQFGRHRGRSGQCNRSESRTGESDRVRFDLARHLGQPFPEGAEEVGARLEPILVQVPGRAFARPEQEVSLEECVLHEEAPELVGHAVVASAAICSNRSSSGDPASSVTDEPSA